jgi:MYXO-CTERM domain-containing protein
MRWRVVLAIATLFLPFAGARAECPKNAIKSAMTARMDSSALGVLEDVLISRMPTSIPVPNTPYTLMTCPDGFDDTVITPLSGDIGIKINSLKVKLVDGAIEVDGDLDTDTTSMLEIQLCALPDATCPGTVSAQGIKVHARIEPTVNACQPSLPVTVAEVTVDPYAATVQLESCGLYSDTFALIYDWFRDTVLALLTDAVESALRESMPALIEGTVTQMLTDGVDVYGLHFRAAAESIAVSSDGIIVRFAANAAPAAGVASCLPPGATLPEEVANAAAPVPTGGSMLAVTLSHPFLQRSVRAAWLSGWLCFDTRTYGLNLGELLEPLAPGASLDATLVVAEPPVVELSATKTNQVQISSGALAANIAIGVPDNPTANVLARMTATLGGRMLLDDAEQALMVQVTDVASTGLIVQATDDVGLIFSQATLDGVIHNFLLPAYVDNMGPLALTSGLFMIAPIAVRLDDVDIRDTFVQANIDLWGIDKNDHVAPHTIISALPPSPSPSKIELHVASIDDKTPAEFMRHAVLIDGVATGVPRSGETLVLTGVKGGFRQITVIAVDVNDNVDPKPIEMTVRVDDLQPVISIMEAPDGVTTEAQTIIDFVVVDDVTPDPSLAVRFEVGRIVPGGAVDELLYAGTLGQDRQLVLEDLPEDQIIRVTIFAKDEAGNEGKTAVAFAVDRNATFACSSGARSYPAALAIILLAALGRYRRRR